MLATIAPDFASTRCTVPSAALAIQTEPNAGTGRIARWPSAIGASDGSSAGAGAAHAAASVVTTTRKAKRMAER